MGKLIEELIWSTQTIFPTGSQLGLVTKKQSPVANFVSRKDLLAEMRDALDGDYRYLLISGIGGSGKSELARKYITEYAAQYDNICMLEYWGNIRETINHGVQFYDDTMCYDYEKLFQDSTRQELFLKKINLLNKLNKAILVIDNFENFADENLRYLLDLNISIILLTREDVATELNHIDITDKMTKAQQKQLFMAYCEVDLESSLIEKLCEACFGHPMTIVLLARIISSKRYTINDIFEKFKNLNKNSLDEPIVYGRDKVYKRQKVSEHIKSLIEIVGLSLIQKQILLDISFSSPFPLQQDYFYKHYPLNNTDLKFLINLNLIKIDQELILIHPLLAESILELIHPDIIKCSKLLDYYNRSYFKRNLGKIYIANMAKKIALYFTKGSLQYYEMMYAGAGYWFDQSEYEISRKIYYYLHELLQENSNIERMADIECKIALVYKYQGKYSDAITIYEQLLYLCNKNSKFNQNLEVRAWIGLGNIYHMLAESEKNVINQKLAKKYFYCSLESYVKALQISKVIDGRYSSRCAAIYDNMALMYANVGQFSKAFSNAKLARKIFRKNSGKSSLEMAKCYINLGEICKLSNELDKALEAYFIADDIKHMCILENHDSNVVTYLNIVEVLCLKGQYEEAKMFCKKAQTIALLKFPPEHIYNKMIRTDLKMIAIHKT